MTRPRGNLATRLVLLVAAFALFATACGGGGGGGPSSEQSIAAESAAATNEAKLRLTGDVASSQVLDTADGAITELADVVTGDRPVLVWYWAPH